MASPCGWVTMVDTKIIIIHKYSLMLKLPTMLMVDKSSIQACQWSIMSKTSYLVMWVIQWLGYNFSSAHNFGRTSASGGYVWLIFGWYVVDICLAAWFNRSSRASAAYSLVSSAKHQKHARMIVQCPMDWELSATGFLWAPYNWGTGLVKLGSVIVSKQLDFHTVLLQSSNFNTWGAHAAAPPARCAMGCGGSKVVVVTYNLLLDRNRMLASWVDTNHQSYRENTVTNKLI